MSTRATRRRAGGLGFASARLILAVPVGAPESVELLRGEADVVICLRSPYGFRAVGHWYDNFDQLTDADVLAVLADV